MSQDNLRLFLEAVAKDEALKASLTAVCADQTDREIDQSRSEGVWANRIIPLAKSKGFDFTLEEVHAHQTAHPVKPEKIADEELDAVVGGDRCLCILGGYGGGNECDPACWCALAGWGTEWDSDLRCSCSGYGFGVHDLKD